MSTIYKRCRKHLAGLLAMFLILSGLQVLPVRAEGDAGVHILDTTADLTAFAAGAKADGDEEKAGTDNFFTVIYSAKTKVDGSKKSFEDGYEGTQRINFGGKMTTAKNAIKFTTEYPATVVLYWAAGDVEREMGILDASGAQVAATSTSLAKNDPCISKFELENAGTYYLGALTNNNYIFRVVVIQTPSGAAPKPERAPWDTVASPEITSAEQSQTTPGNMVVSYRMVVGYDGADKISVDMADATGTVLATKTSSREGDSANFFNNSYQAVASKEEWTSDAGNKITMKLGIGVNAKTGATLEDAEKIKLGQIATPVNYVTSQIPLDTSCEALGAGTYNLIGNYTGSHPFSGYRRGLCCRMADGTGSGDGGSLPGMVQAQTGGSIT